MISILIRFAKPVLFRPLLVFFPLLIWINAVQARQYFVSVNGTANASGTFLSPWSLQAALSMPASVVTGGDTIWLRGGWYIGVFVCEVSGTATKPLVIKAFPGEKVVLDSYTGLKDNVTTFSMEGNYCWLVDVEITNSSPSRISNASTINTVSDLHICTAINMYGVGCKVINCSIHDCPGTGIGFWSTALDAEIYGSFIYYNGISALDRGHGPCIYAQNADGSHPKRVANSFLFNGFSGGIQFYASATVNKLRGLIVDSSTLFNGGALTRPLQGRRWNLMAGSETSGNTNDTPNATRVSDLYIHHNVFYRDTMDNSDPFYWPYSTSRENVELGFQDEKITDKFVSFAYNHLAGDPQPLKLHQWDSGRFVHNFLYSFRSGNKGNRNVIELLPGAVPFSNWDSNTYHTAQPSYNTPFSEKTFQAWKTDYKIDSTSSFTNGAPNRNFIFNRRNKYRPNYHYVTVMNYLLQDSVALPVADYTDYLGASFAVFDVQFSLEVPVMKGRFTGQAIAVPMKSTRVAATAGLTPKNPRHTDKGMGTFVVAFYPRVQTVKAGSWQDATTWSSGRVPNEFDEVELLHPVQIDHYAFCRSLATNTQNISVKPGSNLFISARFSSQ